MIYILISSIVLNLILLLFVVSLTNRVGKIENIQELLIQSLTNKKDEKELTPTNLEEAGKQFEEILNNTPPDKVKEWLEEPKKLDNLNKGYESKQY